MELVRVTEAAGSSSSTLDGARIEKRSRRCSNNRNATVFDTIPMQGIVVIGEGEMDEAPMLYIGEKLGMGNGPACRRRS